MIMHLHFPFFRAHWCPPCRNFTPKLAERYKGLSNEVKEKLDIVFVSLDEDQSSFDEYFNDMPWKALPYSGMLFLFSLLIVYTVQKSKQIFKNILFRLELNFLIIVY